MVGDIDYEKVVNFGAFGYSIEKMASILMIEQEEIKKELNNSTSDFYKHYEKGRHMADYVIDLKLFELAQSGDLKALEEYEFRKNKRKRK